METGSVYYARHENTYVIKLIGEVRYQLGCAFDDFLKRLFAKDDFRDIVIDLTETRMIDSTCLGLLAKIANYARAHFGGKVTMFSTDDDINQILHGVGFNTVFNICNVKPGAADNAQQIHTCAPNQDHLARTLYDAHLILSELNDKNREMFRNVVEMLKDKANT